MSEYSQLPWKVFGPNSLGTYTIFHGPHKCGPDNQICQVDTLARAEFICLAANTHDELLAYAKAEELIASTKGYSEEIQQQLRAELKVPDDCRTIGEHLTNMRRAALAKTQPNEI